MNNEHWLLLCNYTYQSLATMHCGEDNNISGSGKTCRQHSRPLSSALSIPLLFPILACNAFYNPHFFAGLSTYSAFCIAGFFKHMDSFVLTLLLHSTPLRFGFQNLWQLCFQNRKTVSSRNRKQSAAAILQLLKGLARHRFLGTGSLSAQKIGRGGQS